MKIVLTVSTDSERRWKYFLRKKFGKRMGIKRLIRLAVLTVVAEIAADELAAAEEDIEG